MSSQVAPGLVPRTVSPPLSPLAASTAASSTSDHPSASDFSSPVHGKSPELASPLASPIASKQDVAQPIEEELHQHQQDQFQQGSELREQQLQQQIVLQQHRIAELEAQIRRLSDVAAATADRLGQYEQEIQQLRASAPRCDLNRSPQMAPGQLASPASRTSIISTSIASFWSRRANLKSAAMTTTATASASASAPSPRSSSGASSVHSVAPANNKDNNNAVSSSPDDEASNMITDLLKKNRQLEMKLENEQDLRISAEMQLKALSHELEDLSASLFEQANKMVSDELRAKAVLEDRVRELLRRDEERNVRLVMLERAVDRISQTKSVLGPGRAGEEGAVEVESS